MECCRSYFKIIPKGEKIKEDTRMAATNTGRETLHSEERKKTSKERKKKIKREKKNEKGSRSGINEAMEGIVARKRNEKFFQRTCSLRGLYKHLERILVKEIVAH